MINRVVLIGRLTKDLELKHTQTNIPNLRFTLAANRPFLNQNGDKEADYINCIAWKKQAENMAKHLRKGSLIAVEGQTSNFEGQDGKRVYMTEVVAESVQFLDPRSSQQDTSSQQQQPSQQSQQQTNQQQQPVYQQSYQQPSQQQQQYAGGVGGQPSHNWEPNRIGDVSDDDLPF